MAIRVQAPPGVRDDDSTGCRAEAGVSIPLGNSNWSLVPAVEIERLETDNDSLRLDTNRLILNFIYRMR